MGLCVRWGGGQGAEVGVLRNQGSGSRSLGSPDPRFLGFTAVLGCRDTVQRSVPLSELDPVRKEINKRRGVGGRLGVGRAWAIQSRPRGRGPGGGGRGRSQAKPGQESRVSLSGRDPDVGA